MERSDVLNSFTDYLLENKGNIYHVGNYKLQIYSDGVHGNITRRDNTILCRFYIERSKQEIQISFAKERCSTEFGYKRYSVPCTADLSEIKKIQQKDIKELYEVILKFLEIRN